MSKLLDPLKQTTQDLHRFWFVISTEKQWYDIMRECRQWFGKNWQCQSKVRRKLTSKTWHKQSFEIWFEVPDVKFSTWMSVKYGLQVRSDSKKDPGK